MTVASASWWDATSMEGVPSALAAARAAVDAMVGGAASRRTTAELTATSLLSGAVASAQLEGSTSTQVDAAAGAGDGVLHGALRVNADLLSLVPVLRRSPIQTLARLHTLAARGLVDDSDLGRPRSLPGLAVRLQSLAAAVLDAADVPAIAVAAVVHAEIITMAPFEGPNGLVGRAFERLLLVARGVDPASVLASETGHQALEPSYRAGLMAYASGGLAGRRSWLLHAAAAITEAVELSPLSSR